jgi:hypothetical protein
MQSVLSEYYRTPLVSRLVCPSPKFTNGPGFFHFGAHIVCYGECSEAVANDVLNAGAFDASKAISSSKAELRLPFDIGNVVENLRRERYLKKLGGGPKELTQRDWIRDCYYLVRELLPVSFRRHLQRAYFKEWQSLPFPHWPVDFTVDRLHEVFLRLTMKACGCEKVPFIWFWPDGASGCLIITHDVETAAGRDFTSSLMDIDLSHGFKSSFQVVPERRYEVSDSFVNEIRDRGFELNIHDLNHDGYLFEERLQFLCRAKRINEYAKKYNARGFRSGSMYRNQDWYDAFDFSYDMSVPNVAHLEPQRGGCCTVMPYFVGEILELPLTTVQDYTLFHILNDYSIGLWKKQTELILQKYGLLSFITHPDYLIKSSTRAVYESLLDYLSQTCERRGIWPALPGEVDRWWRARSEMKLVEDGSGWRIEGPESKRASLGYATLDDDQLVYTIATPTATGEGANAGDGASRSSPALRRSTS